tara:strand:- start:5473 stop:6069 length:597 start_codon:yes stop_codon:yes gene_type:complete
MSDIEVWYSDNNNVKIMTNLDDIGQPYSCNDWGNQSNVIPFIIEDGDSNFFWEHFALGFQWPTVVYVNHNMEIVAKGNNFSLASAIFTIDTMLEDCGDLCNNLSANEFTEDKNFHLEQNYPNPFNPSTLINYSLKKPGKIKISVFDLNGKIVDTLVDNFASQGDYKIDWNASDLESGMYLIKFKYDNNVSSLKVTLIK